MRVAIFEEIPQPGTEHPELAARKFVNEKLLPAGVPPGRIHINFRQMSGPLIVYVHYFAAEEIAP